MMKDDDVLAAVIRVMGGSEHVEVDLNDPALKDVAGLLPRAQTRLFLSKNGIVVNFPTGGGSKIRLDKIGPGTKGMAPATPKTAPAVTPEKQAKEPVNVPKPKRHQHSYVPPKISKDLIDVLADDASHIPFLVGPTQCGKSTLARYLGSELGRKVFQINCRGDMGSELFFGEKTISIDPATKQNVISYQKGILEQAMTEGLDAQGNETGSAAVLFIDEISACPAHIAHGLNRLFESDDPRRTIVLAEDGGRVVRSHSGFRIILAANTNGRGATDMNAAAYTAQHDALDISLLNRVAVFFRMGYDKKVEQHILVEKVGDDRVARQIIQFRDAVRQNIREGKLSSPLSTAHIVHIADMYRVFRNLGKAIYSVLFESITPEEKPVYNEQALAILGVDLLKEYTQDEIDYM
jgi:cobaltochelatase CobS